MDLWLWVVITIAATVVGGGWWVLQLDKKLSNVGKKENGLLKRLFRGIVSTAKKFGDKDLAYLRGTRKGVGSKDPHLKTVSTGDQDLRAGLSHLAVNTGAAEDIDNNITILEGADEGTEKDLKGINQTIKDASQEVNADLGKEHLDADALERVKAAVAKIISVAEEYGNNEREREKTRLGALENIENDLGAISEANVKLTQVGSAVREDMKKLSNKTFIEKAKQIKKKIDDLEGEIRRLQAKAGATQEPQAQQLVNNQIKEFTQRKEWLEGEFVKLEQMKSELYAAVKDLISDLGAFGSMVTKIRGDFGSKAQAFEGNLKEHKRAVDHLAGEWKSHHSMLKRDLSNLQKATSIETVASYEVANIGNMFQAIGETVQADIGLNGNLVVPLVSYMINPFLVEMHGANILYAKMIVTFEKVYAAFAQLNTMFGAVLEEKVSDNEWKGFVDLQNQISEAYKGEVLKLNNSLDEESKKYKTLLERAQTKEVGLQQILTSIGQARDNAVGLLSSILERLNRESRENREQISKAA